MLGDSIYAYVWQLTRKQQLKICLLVGVVAPLSMLPLELQRRIVDDAVSGPSVLLLALLGVAYLGVILIQGALKYFLNVVKGQVLEQVARDLRYRIVDQHWQPNAVPYQKRKAPMDTGTVVSMLAAESESIGGFASESVSTPLLQVSTMCWVLGYLLWVEPRIAALAAIIYAPQVLLVPQVQRRVNRLSLIRTRIIRRLCQDATSDKPSTGSDSAVLRSKSQRRARHVFAIRMLLYRQKYLLTFLGNFLDAIGPLVVLMVGGYLVIVGQTHISTLVVFISGFQRLSDPWAQLVTFYRSVSNARVTFRLVAQTIDGTKT